MRCLSGLLFIFSAFLILRTVTGLPIGQLDYLLNNEQVLSTTARIDVSIPAMIPIPNNANAKDIIRSILENLPWLDEAMLYVVGFRDG